MLKTILEPNEKKFKTESSTTFEKAINTIQNSQSGSSKNVFNLSACLQFHFSFSFLNQVIPRILPSWPQYLLSPGPSKHAFPLCFIYRHSSRNFQNFDIAYPLMPFPCLVFHFCGLVPFLKVLYYHFNRLLHGRGGN